MTSVRHGGAAWVGRDRGGSIGRLRSLHALLTPTCSPLADLSVGPRSILGQFSQPAAGQIELSIFADIDVDGDMHTRTHARTSEAQSPTATFVVWSRNAPQPRALHHVAISFHEDNWRSRHALTLHHYRSAPSLLRPLAISHWEYPADLTISGQHFICR